MSLIPLNLLKINNVLFRQVCFRTQWSHRRPRKVYTAEEYEELENGNKRKQIAKPQEEENINEEHEETKTKIKWKHPRTEEKPVEFNIRSKRQTKPLVLGKKAKTVVDMLETTLDQDGNLIYTKMKDNDSRINQILTEIKTHREKDKGTILLEGKRLIKDALISKCNLKYLLFSRKEDVEVLKPYLPKMGGHLYKMPYREMQMWSDVETNQGLMAVVKTPEVEKYEPESSLPITVICDNVREPGNLGTILRTCAGLGCTKVVLSKGCVNLWDNKVLRSGAGAHFRLQIHRNVVLEELELEGNIFIADNNILIADGNTEDIASVVTEIPVIPYYSPDFSNNSHVNLIIGGETLGISMSSYKLASKMNGVRLNIPLSNDVESLNVGAALGIITFEIKRQLLSKIK